MDLNQTISFRLRQAQLVGWRLSKRRQINITADGVCTLTLGWRDQTRLRPADPDEPGVDMRDLPQGVSCYVYVAPPDSVDRISPTPTEAEVIAAARRLGCRHVDRGDGADGRTIYWMVK